MAKIILASQSPRRKELLEKMGIRDFSIIVPDSEEILEPGLSPQETVESISRQKSEAAIPLVSPDDIVITADTMVFLGGQKLGKPRDEDHALTMLTALVGNRHEVCTGVTVRRGEQVETFSVTTGVTFREASERELRAYIASKEPMDKAGAYGIQTEFGKQLVKHFDGDYYNVMGLPIDRLREVLEKFGIEANRE